LSDAAPNAARVILDGTQTVRNIQAACARISDALTQNQEVQIDCGAVESADLSLIQLLFAARITARQTGKRLGITAPAGGALHAALEQCGFLLAAGNDPFETADK
jgi:anti-anti-sigma regulatory factor